MPVTTLSGWHGGHLGCAKVEHLSVHWLREVLYLNHHGLLCSGCSIASLSEVCDTDWHVLLWENQLDLLVPSHLGTCLGFLELKAQASSLEAIAESVVTSPPASITDWWTTQLSISGKTTFCVSMHWHPAALSNSSAARKASLGARLREQSEGHWTSTSDGRWRAGPAGLVAAATLQVAGVRAALMAPRCVPQLSLWAQSSSPQPNKEGEASQLHMPIA